MKKNQHNESSQNSLQMLSQHDVKKSRGRGGFLSGLLIGFFAILALISLFSIALWFDLFSLKLEVVTFMGLEKAQLEQIEQRRFEVSREESELLVIKQKLETEEKSHERKRQELNKLEEELNAFQENLNERAEKIVKNESEIDDLVTLYETMPPGQAAEVLMISEDLILTARILSRIDQARLSLILTQLSPQDAAKLISLIASPGSSMPSTNDENQDIELES